MCEIVPSPLPTHHLHSVAVFFFNFFIWMCVVYVLMYTYVYMCVDVCIHVHVCIHVYVFEGVLLNCLFFLQGYTEPRDHLPKGFSDHHPLTAWITGMSYQTLLFIPYWGPTLESLCLHGKHFSD